MVGRGECGGFTLQLTTNPQVFKELRYAGTCLPSFVDSPAGICYFSPSSSTSSLFDKTFEPLRKYCDNKERYLG